MAESLINIRRRINTIKSTEKITKAMKLVSSVKFQRWRRYYQENKPYFEGMKELCQSSVSLCSLKDIEKTECFKKHDGALADLYILVTSSLGLCGAYNFNVFKEFDKYYKEEDEVLCIGEKGRSKYHGKDEFIHLLDELSYSKVRRLRHVILQKYREGKYKNVYLVYTAYKNSLTFIPTVKQILPLNVNDFKVEEELKYAPIVDVQPLDFLTTLFPRYLDSILYSLLLETQVSEQSSRRNAMESATDNADKIVKDLQIVYNKTRQNAITQEITEVVAGANAGKNESE